MNINELIKRKALIRGLSPATIRTYSYVVEKFFRTIPKEPYQISKNDLENYLLKMLEQGAPGNTINVQLNALIFFFEQVLNRKFTINIRYNKIPQRLPEFLTPEECKTFFSHIYNPKHHLMITLLYSTGLRVSELLNLKVKDLQLEQNYGWVRQGKGRKDRVFVVAERVKSIVIEWINNNILLPDDYLFNNRKQRMSAQTVRAIIKKALLESGLSKNVHPHTLRHSFATHLIENGYAVTEVQPLLGHSKIETTLIYTHLAKPKLLNIVSPYDRL
ncbi:tyrosine-type recombinase/integrase [Candidatus Woesearchaeota archaeon]|nr:tyrosine-type recombinase/integrase [Candidatus Woesearchaeota archaeon]